MEEGGAMSPRTSTGPRPIGRTAVVVGASMAGLCAARVAAERFDRVVVLDRDHLPATAEARPQVPQGRQPHLLLVAGARPLPGGEAGRRGKKEMSGGGAVLKKKKKRQDSRPHAGY